MCVLVCGGRDFDDAEQLREVLDRLHREPPSPSHETRGADTLTREWAS
jgi:hypothetical protein